MSKWRYNKAFPYTLDADQIPSRKVVDITRDGDPPVVHYACPDVCWRDHLDRWSKEYRAGNKTAPQPFPWGHCMFDDPVCYGSIPYGCTDEAVMRAAWEQHVRGLLHGWDRDLTKEQLDKIVNATVDARMKGQDVGAFPFMACIAANL